MDDKYGEFNYSTVVRKQMSITANNQGELWKKPTIMDITIKEYQLYKILSSSNAELNHTIKRKLLCEVNYHFFDDFDEDDLTKCQLTIHDEKGTICFKKTYSQVDNYNRRFFTNQ